MSTATNDSKRIRSKKRILSVTIRRIIDESPDTSHLGEYSNRPANEFAIDRAHSEDCASLTPDFYCPPSDSSDWCYWNDSPSRILERVRYALEDKVKDEETTVETFADALDWDASVNDAVETVWELERSAGECDCHGGDMGRNEFRYFNPSFNYVTKDGKPSDGLTAEDVRKYTRQDYERMESLNAGDWCFMGIRAEAEVIADVKTTGPGKWYGTTQRISSGGLWGIESDADRSHLESVQQDELSNLKSELLALGFSKRAIAQAFKPENIKEKDE
jgi:hypothetical protein